MMPNKTIYISDSDLPIFEKAQQLAGDNLSATIVQALRNFIETQETREKNYREITLKVGKVVHTYKRFNGRMIAKGFYGGTDDEEARKIEVYQTAKGRIVLYSEFAPHEWFAGGRGAFGKRGRNWQHFWEKISERGNWEGWQIERTMEIYETLEAAKEHLPSDLYDATKQSLSGGAVEILDI